MSETSQTCTAIMCSKSSGEDYLCADCLEDIRLDILAQTPWMLNQLDLVVTGQVKFSNQPGGRSAEAPLVVNLKASDVRDALVGELDSIARIIAGRNHLTRDYDTPTECVSWLTAHLDKLKLHEAAGAMLEDLTRAWSAADWIIDRPKPRQYLGPCRTVIETVLCTGSIYAYGDEHEARCRTCGGTYEAEEERARNIDELHGRLLSASEIAELSRYLDLPLGREQVRKRINKWHERGLLEAKLHFETGPRFLLLDVLGLLERESAKRAS